MSKKQKKQGIPLAEDGPLVENTRKPSKRQSRKLLQLQKKNTSKAVRASIIEELRQYTLKKEHLGLLQPSAMGVRSKQSQLIERKKRLAFGLPLLSKDMEAVERKLKRKKSKEANSSADCVVSGAEGEATIEAVDRVAEDVAEESSSADSQFDGSLENACRVSESNKVKLFPDPLADSNCANTAASQITKAPSVVFPDKQKAKLEQADNFPIKPVAEYKGVTVFRPSAIMEQRLKLPAAMMEQEIVEAVMENDVVIICGETGCGKSTQVPQYLYEAGFCGIDLKYRIGVTEPRRVAAISVSTRVAMELNTVDHVGYQVRFDHSHCLASCRIKFMTDGILMREVQSDFLLSKYSVIIIDEAHERSVNCDILVGLLSRIVRLRREKFDSGDSLLIPLKVVIMSATLRIEDFTDNKLLFSPPPPVLQIDARTHPVTVHFNRVTPVDYIKAAEEKVLQIHRKLPAGSILVFVSGRHEVHRLCALLNKRSSHYQSREPTVAHATDTSSKNNDDGMQETHPSEVEAEIEDFEDSGLEEEFQDSIAQEDALGEQPSHFAHLVEANTQWERYSSSHEPSVPFLGDMDGAAPIHDSHLFHLDSEKSTEYTLHAAELRDAVKSNDNTVPPHGQAKINMVDTERELQSTPHQHDEVDTWRKQKTKAMWFGSDGSGILHVIPLYAALPANEQIKAFQAPTLIQRNVIIATNVAETSVTLPNIRYIVDSGKEKKRHYIHASGVSYFKVQYISKASADQRAGRCGRVGPGHCYRLYSSAVYNDVFHLFPPVSILLAPLESVLLFIASFGIPKLALFPFPTRPTEEAIRAACIRLNHLGAIAPVKGKWTAHFNAKQPTYCTLLGKNLSVLPILPRYAKMLLAAAAKSITLGPSCLELSCLLVAALSVTNIFIDRESLKATEDGVSSDEPVDQTSMSGQSKKRSLKSKAMQNELQLKQCSNDIDAYLWVCGAFVFAQDKKAFCLENKIHLRRMEEVVSLAHQLAKLLSLRICHYKLSFPLRPSPPTVEQTMALHECVMEGLIDRVAVKCTEFLDATEAPRNSFRSADFKEQEFTFVHPSSFLHHHRPMPSIVAYNQIITTSKHFMFDCLSLDPIALARIKSPLIKAKEFMTLPAPAYIPETDRIVGFVKPVYVPLEYPLPIVEMDVPDSNPLRYRVFGGAFLEGLVFPQLRCYVKDLICNPRTSSVSPNIQLLKLANALQLKQCGSKSTLKEIWQTEPKFLLLEYMNLLRFSDYHKLRIIQELWPL